MRTIDLAVTPTGLEKILKLAGEDNLLLRTRDGKEFVLVELDDFSHEIERTRQNTELMDLLEQRSQEPGRYTLEEVEQKLHLKKAAAKR